MSDAPTKTEGGASFPAEAYAYVPDKAKPSTWKLRLWASPDEKETAKQVGMAIAALSPGGFRGKKVDIPTDALSVVKRRIFAAWRKVHPDDTADDAPAEIKAGEAVDRTFDDIRRAVQDAISAWLLKQDAAEDAAGGETDEDDGADLVCSVWVQDLTTSWAVFQNSSTVAGGPGLFKIAYSLDDATGAVSITGTPEKVISNTTYEAATESTERTVEAHDRIPGRVIEAKGADENGGRIFGVRIIAYGDSKNRRRYPESTLRAAVAKYEGAKAYDHHRTEEELRTSTITGLIGSYRNVRAGDQGLEADLHLLPSAQHTAEALDASLAAEAEGLPPLVGVSHDVYGKYRPFTKGGQTWQEAIEITSVNSADVVADPAAGGRATRMVAGGSGDEASNEEEGSVPISIEELAAALTDASDEDKAGLAQALGLAPAETTTTTTTEATVPEGGSQDTAETFAKGSVVGRMVVAAALEAQQLPTNLAETVSGSLPERFSEADVAAAIEGFGRVRDALAREGMAPTVPDAQVTKDEVDRKREAMDAMFAGDFSKGYRSIKAAWADITGGKVGALDSEDLNRRILRECVDNHGLYESARSTESLQASTFNLILGDSITRRMVAEYTQPSLQSYKAVVSSIVPVNDFRTQRIDRMGGYGTLPGVNEGAPYQPLTSPGNEEATYAATKRGGTEDLTLEMIANDDIRAVMRIPTKLGLAAAQTLFRFVWDMLDTNVTCTYDSTALFAAGHGGNTATSALTAGAVSTGRKVMRKQTAFGDSKDVLSIVPASLIVVSDLEELAWELVTSAVALPTGAPVGAATNIPNLHQGLQLVVVDYWTSATKWILSADPALVPLIELGFYQGRQDPELFVQNDPTVGSVFTSDKVTYKIRHIYGGAVLDHRGFYRGNT